MAYRFGGKQKTRSFGRYEVVGLKEARDKRYGAKKLLRDGIDPGEHKKEFKAAAAKAEQDCDSFQKLASADSPGGKIIRIYNPSLFH